MHVLERQAFNNVGDHRDTTAARVPNRDGSKGGDQVSNRDGSEGGDQVSKKEARARARVCVCVCVEV